MLCDIRLGDMTGLEVLKASKKKHPHVTVIMISAFATTETAVAAMNQGAFDYVPKPFDKHELLQTIAKALDIRTVEHEKQLLNDQLKENLHFGMLVGTSPSMRHIYKLILQVAKTKTNVLITGESGTGKELIARAIHRLSGLKGKFVAVNAAGLDDTVFSDDPLEVAQRWVDAGARRLHMVDLNGAFAGRPVNAEPIRRIADAFPGLPIQVGGGIRDAETIEAYLDAAGGG